MAHTPGPWTVEGRYGYLLSEILAENKAVATVWTHEVDRDKDASYMATMPNPEGEANARLIAAAPELLAALLELVSVPNKHRPERVWEAARTAIAKAME